MEIEEYSWSNGGTRYGFNGMEQDNEIKGQGNAYDFGGRSIYDGRIARFISVDPDDNLYPFMSPYCFAANTPIAAIDYEGRGPVPVHERTIGIINNKPEITYEEEVKYQTLFSNAQARVQQIHYEQGREAALEYLRDSFDKLADISEKKGWKQAAIHMRQYLHGRGDLVVPASYFVRFEHTRIGIQFNIDRFFEAEASAAAQFRNVGDAASGLADGASVNYKDLYQTVVSTNGGSSLYGGGTENDSDELDAFQTELSYSNGNFTVKSEADFNITRKGDKFMISGTVTNTFSDKYDWEKGLNVSIYGMQINDDVVKMLKEVGAKEYNISSTEYKVTIAEGSYFTVNEDGEYDFSNVTFIYEEVKK